MNKSIEDLAKEASKETAKPEFAEMLKDETNLKIFEIMGKAAAKKGDKGPMEFSIMLGRMCYEQGQKDMAKQMGE